MDVGDNMTNLPKMKKKGKTQKPKDANTKKKAIKGRILY
jgi:hypothetical protein